ncbi:unnamed protein product [Dicrocoelium dendriticum]|nr:unnamed protein product [Dicrocoelium dendriticum]
MESERVNESVRKAEDFPNKTHSATQTLSTQSFPSWSGDHRPWCSSPTFDPETGIVLKGNRWRVYDQDKVPSAASLILGRKVVAPNQADGGKPYLATVLSQIDSENFLVSFDRLCSNEHIDSENLQELKVTELLSYLDLYRHSIHRDDYVLVTWSALISDDSERLQSDLSDGFLEPFMLAKVISGSESRNSTNIPQDEPLTVKLVNLSEERWTNVEKLIDRTYKVKSNVALWIKESLATVLFRQSEHRGSHFIPSGTHVHSVDPVGLAVPSDRGAVSCEAIPATYTKAQMERLSSQITRRQIDSPRYKEYETMRNSANKGGFKDEKKEAEAICRHLVDQSTTVDAELEFGRMTIRYPKPKRNVSKMDAKRTPDWRYWGSKPIPGILSPMVHEPYTDAPTWDRFAVTTSKGTITRPEVHFSKVPVRYSRSVDFRDSVQVRAVLTDPSRTEVTEPKTRLDQSFLDLRSGKDDQSATNHWSSAQLNDEQGVFRWQKLDPPGQAMGEYHRERVLASVQDS